MINIYGDQTAAPKPALGKKKGLCQIVWWDTGIVW